jgi:hypothetical protein
VDLDDRPGAAHPGRKLLTLVHALVAGADCIDDRFWDRVTEGLPGGDAAARLRVAGTPELPEHPTAEQLEAWLELAELVADEDFQRTTRANTVWGARAVGAWSASSRAAPQEEFAARVADHAWLLAAQATAPVGAAASG